MDTNGYQQDARQACNLPYLAGASSSTTPASAVPGARERERERGKEEERLRKGGKERERVCVYRSSLPLRPNDSTTASILSSSCFEGSFSFRPIRPPRCLSFLSVSSVETRRTVNNALLPRSQRARTQISSLTRDYVGPQDR